MMRDQLRRADAMGFIWSFCILDWLFLRFVFCNFVDLSLEIDSMAWNFVVSAFRTVKETLSTI